MSAQRKPLYTPDEYLEIERDADYKSEYIAGEIFAMLEEGDKHNVILTNVVNRIGKLLRKNSYCSLGSRLRVQAGTTSAFLYPDALIVRGEPQFRSDGRRDNLLNPSVLVEVLSPFTEANDRGEKFHQYRQIHSLQEYLLVSQTRPRIEHFTRQGDLWIMAEFSGVSATVPITSADCSLPLTEVYEGVTFDAETEQGAHAGR